MTVSDLTTTQLDAWNWLVSWTSDASSPTFYVYRDGELWLTTAETSLSLYAEPGEYFVLEVFDSASASPSYAYPGRLTLCWYAVTTAEYYTVEEYVDAAWVTRESRLLEDGSGFYRWQSRFLEDGETHQFRLTPAGTDGNSGTASTVTWFMVRHPNPPGLSFAYDEGTTKITVSAS